MSIQRINAMIIRYMYVWFRSIERFMWSFGWPFLDLIIWGITSSYLQKQSITSFSIVTFILGGVIFWNILWRAQNEMSVNFLEEAWNHNLINIFSSPLKISEYLISAIILNLIKLIVTVTTLTVSAFVLYKFNFYTTFGWHIPFLLINLLLIGWSAGIFINALLLRYGWSLSELAWAIVFVLQPFSCVFYPREALPVWAQKISLILPSSYVFEEMRSILFSGNINWFNLYLSFGLNLVYLVLSIKFFYYMYDRARDLGKLVKLN
ncbi:MAG: hypothetical protein US11_C0008G0003 [Candidatus Roizmanbacteria bacterium GW2011_GWA2_36_23]|uniref:Transport permease protein n=1 Tax=Candidatus Roizmanbacteria bacterium GW2011_GWA2_36_23 TaxID=1618480 RepID=A0A0G0HBY3_9BACT|nr:MAG: hypothetical protein US11_C0008G0003 [Candidatus Roizmanbacteria bacterium GW2011_GWA2_36_23]